MHAGRGSPRSAGHAGHCQDATSGRNFQGAVSRTPSGVALPCLREVLNAGHRPAGAAATEPAVPAIAGVPDESLRNPSSRQPALSVSRRSAGNFRPGLLAARACWPNHSWTAAVCGLHARGHPLNCQSRTRQPLAAEGPADRRDCVNFCPQRCTGRPSGRSRQTWRQSTALRDRRDRPPEWFVQWSRGFPPPFVAANRQNMPKTERQMMQPFASRLFQVSRNRSGVPETGCHH